jgi:hypothetical protein
MLTLNKENTHMTKLMIAAMKSKIETIAWDCTIGSGNLNEMPDKSLLVDRLGREPTLEETKIFVDAWNTNVQGAFEESNCAFE